MLGLGALQAVRYARSCWSFIGCLFVTLVAMNAQTIAAPPVTFYSLGVISASPTTLTLGQTVTITAKISGAGTATNTTITFTDDKDGLIGACSSAVTSSADKTCTFTPTSGSHTVTVALGTGGTGTASFTVTIPSLTVTPSSLSGGTVGVRQVADHLRLSP
jgi:hypothetical protein